MYCRAQRDFLQRKVFEKEGTLADAKADRKETERDRRIHKAIANLQRLFPGMQHIHVLLAIATKAFDHVLEFNKGMHCIAIINIEQMGYSGNGEEAVQQGVVPPQHLISRIICRTLNSESAFSEVFFCKSMPNAALDMLY